AGESGAGRIALAQLPPGMAERLCAAARERSIDVLAPPYLGPDVPRTIDTAAIGVTGISFAIAQSGTLVEVVTEDSARLVSALPRTHIAVFPADQVVPDLVGAADRMRQIFADHSRGVAVSFISGPSRTGDIEMILTLGVHGPETAHAIAVREGL
ncbi:MAG: lactate utilization protein, partial [Candidatus Hydrogenedentes bacterium]|nr:lactate utilization protein [Candidatus Hydrogenedentota bacterium]